MTVDQPIIKKGEFDAAHRVMNEAFKCFNVHGHRYAYELHISGPQLEIGYAVDFKEVKRVAMQWIDDMMDHGSILNPHDQAMRTAAIETGSKCWLMSLNGKEAYCNPTVENIAKELFLAVNSLLADRKLTLLQIVLWETPTCGATCIAENLTDAEVSNFLSVNYKSLQEYSIAKSTVEYDDRKFTKDKK